MSDVPRFDPLGPLPTGRTAIEASAGTGKTYALAGLATRFVVEQGVPVAELLVVTFTRAASAELRDRIRERIAQAVEALSAAVTVGSAPASGSRPGAGAAAGSGTDPLLAHLCTRDLSVRLARAQTAIAEFDTATITTIHGFAQQVLATLGASAPGDGDAVLDDDQGELLRQVVTDVLVAESLQPSDPTLALPSLEQVVAGAREVLGNPGIAVLPPPQPEHSNALAALRRRLVDTAVAEVDGRRRSAGVLSFDDLLIRLRDALDDERSGTPTRVALRRRFQVALIDEFQDTDPVQWAIFRSLFGEDDSPTTLILVGDPKQAIYGFRGANVHSYLEAAHSTGTARTTLATNWRSDGAVLQGLEALLSGATFGDERITFTPVDPAPEHRDRRLRSIAGDALPGVSIRLALGADLDRSTRGQRLITVDDAEHAVYSDLASQVRDLLGTAMIPTPHGTRAVRPSDITVLVTAHSESPKVQKALKARQVPAIIARGDTVLTAPAATQWRWLLEAIAQPADPQRARTACLSWFIGWSADELAVADDRAVAEVQEQLHIWAETLLTRGVIDFRRRLWSESGVAARVLRAPDGDRSITDLEHIAELLAATAARRPGPAGLLSTLDQLALVTTPADVEVDIAARRVESEADAVQIMTVHAAKGLEFPIVCCPTLWRVGPTTAGVRTYRDPDSGRRTVDLAPKQEWPDKTSSEGRARLAEEETRGQNLRLLYVALTRARHQTIVWWTRTKTSGPSASTALARVLFARDAAGIDHAEFGAKAVDLPDDDAAEAQLAPLVARSQGTVAVVRFGRPAEGAGAPAPAVDAKSVTDSATDPAPEPVTDPVIGQAIDLGAHGAGDVDALAVAVLGRELERRRRRWSFTAMTSEPHLSFEPRDETLDEPPGDLLDEPDDRVGDEPVDESRNELPGGVADLDESRGEAADEPSDEHLDGFPAGIGPGRPVGIPADVAPIDDASRADEGRMVSEALLGVVAPLVEVAMPFAAQRGGAAFGSLLHQILERVDVADPDLERALQRPVDEELARSGLAVDRAVLLDGLTAMITTPLGAITGGRALAQIAARDRLAELDFELTLAEAGLVADDRSIGRLVARHLAPDHGLRPWAESLAAGGLDTSLAGHLVGSIDAVLRVPGPEGAPQFVVVDYKSNTLTPRGEQPSLDDYHPDRLPAAMADHHYPLQALLYSVALHRYLRWRLVGYRPERHLGGIAYLFLRGMVGPLTPVATNGQPYGVYSWFVPPALVCELSDLLDGQEVAA